MNLSFKFLSGLLRAFLIIILYNCISDTAIAQTNVEDLVQQVQLNSQQSYDSIHSLRFHGRSKYYLYMGVNAFDLNTVLFYEEYYFDGFWMKPDSLRIQVTALRKVIPDTIDFKREIERNIALPNPFQFSHDFSVMKTYKNEKSGKAFKWALYPFATGADSLYNYEIVSSVGFGSVDAAMRRIVEVFVSPKYPDFPAVTGSFRIDVDKKVVVGSDIVFNEATNKARHTFKKNNTDNKGRIIFTVLQEKIDEDHRTNTKKALFFSQYWLPNTIEEEVTIHAAGIKVRVHRVLEFLSYQINPPFPDTTIFKDEKLAYNTNPEHEKELFDGLENPDRLTNVEEELIIEQSDKAFASMNIGNELFDLESIAGEALKMRMKQKSGKYFQFAQRMGDFFIYNRVEGLHLNYGLTFSNLLINRSSLAFKGAYGLRDNRWKGEASWLHFLDQKERFFIEANLYNTITYNENRKRISTGKNTFTSLFLKSDYRDYYYKEGGNLGIGFFLTKKCAVKIHGVNQFEKNAVNNTRFSIFKHSDEFRLNPEIIEGNLKAFRALLLYRSGYFNTEILMELSDKKRMNSDFTYSLVKTNVNWNYKINSLNNLFLSVSAAGSNGELPPQRWFDFGGKSLFNYYGNLRGVNYKAFTGDRMASGIIEYTKYLMRLLEYNENPGKFDDLKKAVKLTFWTGLGWSELSERNRKYAGGIKTPMETTEGVYHEIGIGIGDRFNIARIDFIRNSIDKNKIVVSVNFFK